MLDYPATTCGSPKQRTRLRLSRHPPPPLRTHVAASLTPGVFPKDQGHHPCSCTPGLNPPPGCIAC